MLQTAIISYNRDLKTQITELKRRIRAVIRTMLSIICLIVVRISIVQSRGNLVNCGKNFAKDCSSCHMGPLGFGFFKDKNYCNGEL